MSRHAPAGPIAPAATPPAVAAAAAVLARLAAGSEAALAALESRDLAALAAALDARDAAARELPAVAGLVERALVAASLDRTRNRVAIARLLAPALVAGARAAALDERLAERTGEASARIRDELAGLDAAAARSGGASASDRRERDAAARVDVLL